MYDLYIDLTAMSNDQTSKRDGSPPKAGLIGLEERRFIQVCASFQAEKLQMIKREK